MAVVPNDIRRVIPSSFFSKTVRGFLSEPLIAFAIRDYAEPTRSVLGPIHLIVRVVIYEDTAIDQTFVLGDRHVDRRRNMIAAPPQFLGPGCLLLMAARSFGQDIQREANFDGGFHQLETEWNDRKILPPARLTADHVDSGLIPSWEIIDVGLV